MLYTPSQGYQYPPSTDQGAAPADLEVLAAAVDTDMFAWQAGFTAGPRPVSFLVRTTVDNSAIGAGSNEFVNFQTTDWNNAPAGTSSFSGGNTWRQTPGEGVCWWFLSWCVIYKNSATPTLGGWTYTQLSFTDTNPVTNRTVSRRYTTDNYDDVGTLAGGFSGGTHFGSAVVQCSGAASAVIIFGNGDTGTTKFPAVGCTVYGFRIGGVAS